MPNHSRELLTALLTAAVMMLAPAAMAADADTPVRGMSKAEVRERLGEPRRERAAVGQPPISRWEYDGFTVYFEHGTALHSVSEERDGNRSAKATAPATLPRPDNAKKNAEEMESELESEVEDEEEEQEEDGDGGDRRRQQDDDEPSSESTVSPGSTGVRADAGETASDEARDNKDEDEETSSRFRFDPSSGRIVVNDSDEDGDEPRGEESAAQPAEASQEQ